MAPAGETRIQLCGRFVVRLDGRRVEDALAGAKGQLLFAYLVLNRFRRIGRDELLDAVYGEEGMPDHYPRLSVLLSKLRGVVGPELLAGRSQIDVVLPPDAFVDVEAALDGLHRAESHVAAGEWAEAWGPAGIAYHVASRPLLQGHDRSWVDEWRRPRRLALLVYDMQVGIMGQIADGQVVVRRVQDALAAARGAGIARIPRATETHHRYRQRHPRQLILRQRLGHSLSANRRGLIEVTGDGGAGRCFTPHRWSELGMKAVSRRRARPAAGSLARASRP